MVFQAKISRVLDANEQSTSNGEGRGQRNNESWYRVHERELQRNHERGTLLNYSEIRQLTSRFIGYLPENELMMMTPNEWKDWIIGGQDKYLDQKRVNDTSCSSEWTLYKLVSR